MASVLLLLVSASLFVTVSVNAIPAEDDVHYDLFRKYNPESLPRRRLNESVEVELSFSLIGLDDINEQSEQLEALFYINMEWEDYRLSWKPEDYDELVTAYIDPKNIWKPDLCSYQGDSKILHPDTKVVLSYAGKVNWIPFKKYTVYCRKNTTITMDCDLKLGSWIHTASEMTVKLQVQQLDISRYAPRGEWVLKDASLGKNTAIYSCCPGKFESINISMMLKKSTENCHSFSI